MNAPAGWSTLRVRSAVLCCAPEGGSSALYLIVSHHFIVRQCDYVRDPVLLVFQSCVIIDDY